MCKSLQRGSCGVVGGHHVHVAFAQQLEPYRGQSRADATSNDSAQSDIIDAGLGVVWVDVTHAFRGCELMRLHYHAVRVPERNGGRFGIPRYRHV